jgi:Putative zinc-finger
MAHLSFSQLNEYLDETLEASTRENVQDHLQSCPECQARLNEIQGIFRLLGELPESELEHDLRPTLMLQLGKKPTLPMHPIFAVQAGAALGTVLWLVIAASSLIRIPAIRFPYPGFQFPNLDPVSLGLAFQRSLPNALTNLPPPRLILPDSLMSFARLPELGTQPSLSHLALLIVSTLILGLIGNALLMDQTSRIRK